VKFRNSYVAMVLPVLALVGCGATGGSNASAPSSHRECPKIQHDIDTWTHYESTAGTRRGKETAHGYVVKFTNEFQEAGCGANPDLPQASPDPFPKQPEPTKEPARVVKVDVGWVNLIDGAHFSWTLNGASVGFGSRSRPTSRVNLNTVDFTSSAPITFHKGDKIGVAARLNETRNPVNPKQDLYCVVTQYSPVFKKLDEDHNAAKGDPRGPAVCSAVVL